MRTSSLGNKNLTKDVRAIRPLLAQIATSYQVKVSDNDTTPGYLEAKIVSDDGSVVVSLNDGADEDLDLSVSTYVSGELATHTADPDAHHNQSHVLASTSGLGADHTVSGLTARQVLIATGATTALFRALEDADIPASIARDSDVTAEIAAHAAVADVHHALVTMGADTAPLFSIGAGQVLNFDPQTANTFLAGPASGGAADPTMRAIVFADVPSSSAVSTATAVLLASDGNGRLRLQGLGIGQAAANNALEISKASGSPAAIISAGDNGEIATPSGEALKLGHWNSGTATFTQRVDIGATGTTTVFGLLTIDTDSAGTLFVEEFGASSTAIRSTSVLRAEGGSRVDIYVNSGVIAQFENGLRVGSPTGGDRGAGTINAQAVYDDNTLLTDYVFEADYALLSIDAMTEFYQVNKHLPTIPGREAWEARGKFSLGQLANHLWETVEVQAIYISQLHERLAVLEAA